MWIFFTVQTRLCCLHRHGWIRTTIRFFSLQLLLLGFSLFFFFLHDHTTSRLLCFTKPVSLLLGRCCSIFFDILLLTINLEFLYSVNTPIHITKERMNEISSIPHGEFNTYLSIYLVSWSKFGPKPRQRQRNNKEPKWVNAIQADKRKFQSRHQKEAKDWDGVLQFKKENEDFNPIRPRQCNLRYLVMGPLHFVKFLIWVLKFTNFF